MKRHSKTILFVVVGLLLAGLLVFREVTVAEAPSIQKIWLDVPPGATRRPLSKNEERYAHQILKQYGTIWSHDLKDHGNSDGRHKDLHYLFVKNSNYKKAMAAWKLASKQKAEAVCQNTLPKKNLVNLKSWASHWNIEMGKNINVVSKEQEYQFPNVHYHIHGIVKYQCQ